MTTQRFFFVMCAFEVTLGMKKVPSFKYFNDLFVNRKKYLNDQNKVLHDHILKYFLKPKIKAQRPNKITNGSRARYVNNVLHDHMFMLR
jgi:hypothetical protein